MSHFGINQNYRMSGVSRKQCRMNTVFAFDDMKNQKEIKSQYTKTSRPNFAPIKKQEKEDEKKHEEDEEDGDEKEDSIYNYSYIQSITNTKNVEKKEAKEVNDTKNLHINKITLKNIKQRCFQLSADHY